MLVAAKESKYVTHPRIREWQICVLAPHMALAGNWMNHKQDDKRDEEYLMGDVEHVEIIQNLQKDTPPPEKISSCTCITATTVNIMANA